MDAPGGAAHSGGVSGHSHAAYRVSALGSERQTDGEYLSAGLSAGFAMAFSAGLS